MIVFYMLLLVPILIQHIGIKGRYINFEKKNRKALLFFFLLLTFLVIFRHESIGNDTRNYMDIFKSFSVMDWRDVGKKSVEFGFAYFNKFVSILSKEPRFFLAITTIIVNAMIYPTYKRLCKDASVTIVLFCIMSTFVLMFSGIRQMLAVGIGFITYEFTRKKNFVAYLLCVVLAITFHTSAFMLIFMYPIYHAKITKKWLFAIIPLVTTIFVFNQQVFSVLVAFLERFTKYEGDITRTGAYTMLILFVIFAIFSFLVPEEEVLDKETIGLRNFLLLSIVIQIFAPLHNLAMRMNYYYIIFIPLLLPKIIECKSKRWEQVAMFGRHAMIVFFLVYFFLIKANSDGNLGVFPYHFFWENI